MRRSLPPSLQRVIPIVKATLSHLDKVRTFGLASEMAFWVFLALVPLAAVAGLVAAKVAMHHLGSMGPMMAGLPPFATEFIRTELTQVAAWNKGAVALPAAVVFVWLASSGVHSIFDALELQTLSSRPWWKKRLLALVTCVALSFGVGILAILRTGIGWIAHVSDTAVPAIAGLESSVIGGAVRVAFGCLILFGLLAGLYWVGVPSLERRRFPIAPGAALATAVLAAMGWGYGAYISTVGSGSAYQGALAVIGATMTTLYLFAIAILLGAELNRYVAERARFQRAESAKAALESAKLEVAESTERPSLAHPSR